MTRKSPSIARAIKVQFGMAAYEAYKQNGTIPPGLGRKVKKALNKTTHPSSQLKALLMPPEAKDLLIPRDSEGRDNRLDYEEWFKHRTKYLDKVNKIYEESAPKPLDKKSLTLDSWFESIRPFTVYGSTFYRAINNELRGGGATLPKSIRDKMTGKNALTAKDTTERLLEIANHSPLSKDTLLFRGIRHSTKVFGVKKLEDLIGKTISEPGFMSTTTSPALGGHYTKGPSKTGQDHMERQRRAKNPKALNATATEALIVVHAKKGQKALPISRYAGDSRISMEHELALPPGTKLKFVGVERDVPILISLGVSMTEYETGTTNILHAELVE